MRTICPDTIIIAAHLAASDTLLAEALAETLAETPTETPGFRPGPDPAVVAIRCTVVERRLFRLLAFASALANEPLNSSATQIDLCSSLWKRPVWKYLKHSIELA